MWWWLKLPGAPAKSCLSPFRPDKKASLSVWTDARGWDRWKDHASDHEGGDVIDFIAAALKCDNAEALRWAREKCGGGSPPPSPAPAPAGAAKPKPMPQLREGSAEEIAALAALRWLRVGTLLEAQARGLLAFAVQWGQRAWFACCPHGRIVEGRRLDGLPWPAFGQMPERKCHAWGAGKAWPVGLEHAAHCGAIVLCEGGPDCLAAIEIIADAGKDASVAPVAMLGAANTRFDPAALPFFRGKIVRILAHADDAGHKAARAWARQLVDAGAARVDAFDFAAFRVKDANDFVKLPREQRENVEVMP